MKCTKCGKINDDSFRFCQYCGTPTGVNSEIHAAIDTPESLPNSEISTPSPSIVETWLHPENVKSGRQNTTLNQHRLSSGIDIPLSSIGDDNGMADDLSKLIALDSKPEHKAVPAPGERICLNCGSVVTKGHHFCGNCGAKYNSDFELAPIPNNLSDLASEANASKRIVKRVSFVNDFVIPSGQEIAKFTLFHVNDDGSLGEQITLNEGENIIGKNSSSALNNDKFVSPKHLRIICYKDKAVVEDYGSLNGVFVRLSGDSADLFDGDSFRIGEELLSYSHGKSKQQLLSSKHDDTELLGSDEPECWGYIRLILGPFLEGSVYRMYDEEVTMGRTHADILFPKDGFVSGLHAKIVPNGESATIIDLNSSNGTFVKLRNSITVYDIEYLLVGNQLLRLKANTHK